MEKKIKIKSECAFCSSSEFKLPYHDYVPKSGEKIICASCGKENDFDDMQKVVLKKKDGLARQEAQKLFQNAIKGVNKNLKIKL